MRLHELNEITYKEIEFVCSNKDFAHATGREAQVRFFGILKEIPGLLPYMQEWKTDQEEEYSLSVIITNREEEQTLSKLVLRLARDRNVKVDLIKRVSNTVVDDVVTGRLERLVQESLTNRVNSIVKKTVENRLSGVPEGRRDLTEYDAEIGQVPPAGRRFSLDNSYKDSKTQRLGGGRYSVAVQNPDNPHDVVKMSKSSTGYMGRIEQNDGYIVFANALAKDKDMQDNIHMPKIRTYKVTADNQRYQARLETLEPIQKASARELYEAIRRYFPYDSLFAEDQSKIDWIKKQLQKANSIKAGSTIANTDLHRWVQMRLKGMFVEFINSIPAQPSASNELNNAYNWIVELGRETGFYIDLHDDNIMLRRGPYGIVPVLNDPFSEPT